MAIISILLKGLLFCECFECEWAINGFSIKIYIIISLAELSLAVADRGYSEVVVSAGFTLCTKTIIFELCEPFGVGNHSK